MDLSRYTDSELKLIDDIFKGQGAKYHIRPYNLFTLETPTGDNWDFDSLEEAKRNQYLFGGTITKGFKEAAGSS